MIEDDAMCPATDEDVRRFKQCVGKKPLSAGRALKQTRVRRKRRRKWSD